MFDFRRRCLRRGNALVARQLIDEAAKHHGVSILYRVIDYFIGSSKQFRFVAHLGGLPIISVSNLSVAMDLVVVRLGPMRQAGTGCVERWMQPRERRPSRRTRITLSQALFSRTHVSRGDHGIVAPHMIRMQRLLA